MIARAGANERRPEAAEAGRAVAAQGYRIANITEPGTLDGGDILKIGSTVYAGHAWRAGNGVADRWGSLRRGDVIKVAGCRFEVTGREYWPASRRMGSLYSVAGPARIVLVGCKADDYSRRTVVFARKIGRS